MGTRTGGHREGEAVMYPHQAGSPGQKRPLSPSPRSSVEAFGQKWARRRVFIRAACVFVALLMISALQELTPASLVHWHYILQRAYYVPIILGGIALGWRGGIISAAIASVCYFASAASPNEPTPYEWLDEGLEGMMFCVVGCMTGIFADRERRQKKQLQENAQQLTKLYTELQDSFEHMKRTERLSALGQLSAGLAHEIRNPLASIEGAATVLQGAPDCEQRRSEFLQIIQKECRRLDRLLTNFLEFARPRPPAFMSTDIGLVLDSVIVLAGHALSPGCITLSKQLSDNMPVIDCDAEQLKQVMLNLTLNAIQAMPHGGQITLSAGVEHRQAVIQVVDEGLGIRPDHLDRIFDPFFTTKANGTGLGLAVAHQIVQQHGGSVVARRNPSEGMTFAIMLPLRH